MSYEVEKFVKPKKEDYDNGCGPAQRADDDALRYERTRGEVGKTMQDYLWEKDCFSKEGQEANRDGANKCDCPYPVGSDGQNGWMIGWQKEEDSDHETVI